MQFIDKSLDPSLNFSVAQIFVFCNLSRFTCGTQFIFFYLFFLEKIHLPDENSLQFNGSLLVKKRGRTTGDTIGKLVDDCLYICVDSTKVQGRYYVFEKCFAVKGRDETKFFDKGDSGSGVFLIDKKDNSLKALGIAFAFFQTKTAVCKIRQITDAFNVSVYGYEEPMDIS